MTKREKLIPGKFYHIYHRGNNKGKIFFEKRNYPYFLRLFTKHIYPVAETFSYCLLPNHFHFLVRFHDTGNLPKIYQTESPNLSQSISNWLNAYAKSINKAYNRTGHLFEERFKRNLVEDEIYFINLIYYIHANPQKHRLIHDFRRYPFSSYQSFCTSKPTKLMREYVWDSFGDRGEFIRFHAQYHEHVLEKLQLYDPD